MTALKSRWKKKGTGEIIHPETEIDQLKNGENALSSVISTLLKAATTANARSAIESAAASHQHASGDITSFATSVINAIGTETLSALGVRYSITTNGYICFGDLFGGLILQWTTENTFPLISSSDKNVLLTGGPYTFPISMNTFLCSFYNTNSNWSDAYPPYIVLTDITLSTFKVMGMNAIKTPFIFLGY